MEHLAAAQGRGHIVQLDQQFLADGLTDQHARGQSLADSALAGGGLRDTSSLAAHDLATLIQELTTQMHDAATELHFELAARLRDEISDLKKELRQMTAATS